MLIPKLKEILTFAEIIPEENLDIVSHSVSASATADQIESLSAFGIDIKTNIKSILFHEAVQGICRDIVKALFERAESLLDYEVEKKIDKYHVHKDLFDTVLNKLEDNEDYNFVISNGQLSTVFNERIIPIKSQTISHTGLLFQIGSYENIDFYTDPYMKWDDMRMLLGREKIKIYVDPNFTIKETVGNELQPNNRTVIEFKYKFEFDDSKYYRINVIDKHHLLII